MTATDKTPEQVLDEALLENTGNPIALALSGARYIFQWQTLYAPQTGKNKDQLLKRLAMTSMLQEMGAIDIDQLISITNSAINQYFDGFLHYLGLEPRTAHTYKKRYVDIARYMQRQIPEGDAGDPEIKLVEEYLDTIEPTEAQLRDYDRLTYDTLSDYLVLHFMALTHRTEDEASRL